MPDSNRDERSPWWYRRRDAVFGIIYAAGFFGAWAFATATQHPYQALLWTLGRHYGENGWMGVAALMLLLMAASYALRLWGSSYLHTSVVWSDDARTDSLIVAGPFRYTRNPLYLGNVLMALGFGLFAPLFGWVVINVLNAAFIVALIRWEERGLRARYGEVFDAYCQSVPQVFPRIPPAAPNAFVRPSLSEGLRSEIFVGCLFAGMIVILITPSVYGFTAFVALYVTGIVAQRIAAGRRENSEKLG